MIETTLPLLMALAAGVFTGIFFFGGLWWTSRKAIASKIPIVWFFTSLIVRTAVALFVFFLVGRNNLTGMLLCLLGFIAARTIVVHYTKMPRFNKAVGKEVNYENES